MWLLRSPARPQSIRFRVAEVSTLSATGLHSSCGRFGAFFKRICAGIGKPMIGSLAPLPLRILRSSRQDQQLANQPLKKVQRNLSCLLQTTQKPRQMSLAS
jgi:hypothetical protein